MREVGSNREVSDKEVEVTEERRGSRLRNGSDRARLTRQRGWPGFALLVRSGPRLALPKPLRVFWRVSHPQWNPNWPGQ